MLQHYIKIALRQLSRHKGISSLNILGLALGMALVIMIGIFIKSEFSYDVWMDESENVYRVTRYRDNPTAWTPTPLAAKMINDYPEVANAAGWSFSGENLLSYAGNDIYVDKTAQADSNFFDVIRMEFDLGNQKTALKQVNSMVISDKLAKRLFGNANPIGETVKYQGQWDYIISAVLNTSKNSHFDMDVLIPFYQYGTRWAGNSRLTYARLKPMANAENLAQKIDKDATEIIRKEYEAQSSGYAESDFFSWHLQPLNKVYLHSDGYTTQLQKVGNIRNVYIFGIIALLILLVAIVNYINLTTARASLRSKEVGVKKVTGAGNGMLTQQFLTESFVQSTVAGLLALVLAAICLPFFNGIMDRELSLFSDPLLILLGTVVMVAVTGLLAGFYPAFVLSSFSPINALKADFFKSGGQGLLRKVLVTGQFTVSITLLIIMSFIYRQVNYMNAKDLGFQPDQVVAIQMNDQHTHRKVAQLKSRFKQIPGIKEIATASALPGDFIPDWQAVIEGRNDRAGVYILFGDEDLAATLDLEMVEGRFIKDDISEDSLHNFVVNETFIKENNIENPIGQKMKFSWQDDMGQIIGVVKDFHYAGLNKEIKPLVMNARHWRQQTTIKLSTSDVQGTLASIEKLWGEIEPNYPIRYAFLDAHFQAQYSKQVRFGKTVLYATFITLFIALLGLFGLTTFSVERRTREIGIRKVLGSSVTQIIGLLAKDFMYLLGLAFLISVPLSYMLSNQWLSDFAHRTNMAWWVFIGAGVLILTVGFLTVFIQSIKAALTNPVESLRSE